MKQFLLILTLFTFSFSNAQNLYESIPNNSFNVNYVNLGALNSKSGGEDWSQLMQPFFKESHYYYHSKKPILKMNDLFKNLNESGLDMNAPMYVYNTMIGQLNGTIYLFKLKDESKFTSFIGKTEVTVESIDEPIEAVETPYYDEYYYKEEEEETTPYFLKKNVGNGVMYLCEKQVIGIFGDVAYIFNITNGDSYLLESELAEREKNNDLDNDYGYDYTYAYPSQTEGYKDSIYLAEKEAFRIKSDSLLYSNLNNGNITNYEQEAEKFESLDPEITARAKARLKEREAKKFNEKFEEWATLLSNLLQAKPEHIGNDRNFLSTYKSNHDFFAYTKLNKTYLNVISKDFGMTYLFGRNKREPELSEYLQDISSIYSIDFKDGKAELNGVTNLNQKLLPSMKTAYSLKQSKNLFKYIEGTNLQGYFSFAVNSFELTKPYEKIYFEFLKNMGRNTDLATGAELFWSFIDKDMLFNTIGNQTIVAVTGYADIKMNYISYDYDDNFERTETKEERLVKQPKVVIATAINSVENANKLFEIISKFTFFEKINDNLIKVPSNRNFKTNLFILKTKDAIIFTNDEVLVTKYPNGLPSKDQIASSEQKFILSHNFAAKTFTDPILTGIRNNYFANGGHEKWYTPLYNGLGDLEMYDEPIKGNQYTLHAVVNIKDISSNSFQVLLKMMNQLKNVH
jgi:hypothetical protein